MKEYTLFDSIKDFIFSPYEKMKYYFAKKWLDETFGEQEFWGDYLADKIYGDFYKTLK